MSVGNEISLADDPAMGRMLPQGTTETATHTVSRIQHHLYKPSTTFFFSPSKNKVGEGRLGFLSITHKQIWLIIASLLREPDHHFSGNTDLPWKGQQLTWHLLLLL